MTVDVRNRTDVWSQRKRCIVEVYKKNQRRNDSVENRFLRVANNKFGSKKRGKQ